MRLSVGTAASSWDPSHSLSRNWVTNFETATSTDARTAARRAVWFLGVTSLPFRKEVTKKGNSDVPSEASPSLPLYKAEQEKDICALSASLATQPPRAADAESKKSCGFLKGSRPLS